MTKQDILDLATLIQNAKAVILLVGPDDHKVGLGRDLQDAIVIALQSAAADEEVA